ncbi:MAG: UDP-N-acetylenolpyruvoylglucosamine reductase, partial [Bacillota bacterium]
MPDYNKNILAKKLKKINNLTVKTDVTLKKYTSFQVGGPADIFVVPQNISALKNLLEKINFQQTPVFILGKGTNIIAGDRGFKGIIIHTVNL